MSTPPPLSDRQELILRRLVEAYIAGGTPVGSKTLVESGAVAASSSTVRYELAELEGRGMLGHPHTSAGRVPTDLGYRAYADILLRVPVEAARLPVDLGHVRRELDAALKAVAEALAQTTNLLAAVSAPSPETMVVRHVELLLLQPQVVMAVVITATGGVAKRLFVFDDAVDPGLVDWAGEYLEETVTGLGLGARAVRQRLGDPELGERERAFLQTLQPVFTDVAGDGAVYLGGTAGLLSQLRERDVEQVRSVVDALEQRFELLEALRDSLGAGRLRVSVGEELGAPGLSSLSLVAAGYGVANRTLGTVALLGPTRMDYARALSSVRGAAVVLSEFVEDLYD